MHFRWNINSQLHGFMQIASTSQHRLLNIILERPAIEWTYLLCFLPRLGDSFFLEDEETVSTEGNYVNQLLLQPNANEMNNTHFHSQENMAINNCGQQEFDLLLQERQEHSNRILMFHLNFNSLQNKFDELKLRNDEMKSQIIFLSKINRQFTLTGYNMYRKDRKKGGGGIIAYFDSRLYPWRSWKHRRNTKHSRFLQ